jgi:hypothetical protein
MLILTRHKKIEKKNIACDDFIYFFWLQTLIDVERLEVLSVTQQSKNCDHMLRWWLHKQPWKLPKQLGENCVEGMI